MRSLATAAALAMMTAPARADDPVVHVDATATAAADSGGDGLSGGATGRAFLGDPDGAVANVGLTGSLDVHRIPWLDARRDLAASPYSAGTIAFEMGGAWPAGEMVHFPGAVSVGWPMELLVGATLQDGVRRNVGGGHARALRNCWAPGADGESTCLSWFGGGGADIHDGVYSYGTVEITILPLEGLAIGPLRADIELGGAGVDRSRLDLPLDPGHFHVSAFRWDVRLRGHAGPLALAVASRREPYAASDGTLSLDDRVSVDAAWTTAGARWSSSVYAARSRWWTAPDPVPSRADIAGAELSVTERVLGLDVALRAAVGRSFYPALDGAMPDAPGLGARAGIEITAHLTP